MDSVVSYRNSTSNHNIRGGMSRAAGVVSYRNSTSNHNVGGLFGMIGALYLIEILHQTTTPVPPPLILLCCILSKFYIKPQLIIGAASRLTSCILSKFYIKPQLVRNYYSYSQCCILSKFYIKPQHPWRNVARCWRCILSKFYIKPQQQSEAWQLFFVVSYRNSTSNHNFLGYMPRPSALYLIEILHQTTTSPRA